MKWQFRDFWWRLLPGGITALAVAGLSSLGTWQPLEQIAYNALFRSRGPTPWNQRVVVVAIDEPSLKQLGRFPWPRQRYTNLINVLAQAEPSAIVLNVLFPERSPDDKQLAAVMERQGRVVIAQAWDNVGVALLPSPELQAAAIAQGHIYKREDSDGVTRKVDLQVQGIPALEIAAVQTYALVKEPIQFPNFNQPLWINWPGSVQQIQQYSFAQVLQRQVPAQAFKDKIVLIGITASGFDPLVTPFDRNPPASGVYLHAAVIGNLLQHNFLRIPGSGWLLLILSLGGPGLSWVMTHWNTGRQLVGLTGLCVGWWVLSLLLLKVGYWSPTALPIVLFSLTGGAVALNERLRENFLLKREVEQLWQAHYRDLVVEGTKSQTRTFEVHGWNLNQQPVSMQRVAQLAALAEQFGRSQSAQAAIARSLSIGLLAADLDGRVWFCNPVATDWLKVQVGDRLLAQLIPQWLSQPEWQADLDLLRYSQQAPYRELQRGDRWFALKLEPLFYQSTPTNDMERSDQLSGLLLVLEDITASKQVEANLNLQMQELQRMNLLKDDFLSTVSHELRTPMTNMKMAIHLLKLSRNEEQRDHYLRILQDECAREISLINDLLDLQRLEVTAKPLVSEVIDLADWLPLVVEPFLERAETRQQTLQTEIPRDLPPLVSDRLSLERVLAELINNACKYTPPGGEITVKVHYIPAQIELIVSNSGSEIAEAELERIFDKFYRIPRHDPWKQGGTGLGLALVKKLVEHLGGNIQVWSRDGETKFIVQLPAEFQETTDASEN